MPPPPWGRSCCCRARRRWAAACWSWRPAPYSGRRPWPLCCDFGGLLLGVALGALGIYQPLVEFAGAGASVPLAGFGNLLAGGVKEAVAKEGFLGIFTGGLTACAGGVAAALCCALVMALVFRPREK